MKDNFDKLNIGVIGAGHLGKIHLNILSTHPNYNLIGLYDINLEVTKELATKYQIRAFESAEDLIKAVQVVDIVTPTIFHHQYCMLAISLGTHFFVEKPITQTTAQAKELINAADAANILGQVGHVERFNPAILAASKFAKNPLFIEAHRLSEFKPRGTDVSVVLDLMIHDIDLVLSMVKAPIHQISASGVSVISENIDIANARLEFENGCVANLTASRVSLKNERKIRIFQPQAYLSIDLNKKESNIFQLIPIEEATEETMIIDPGDGKPARALNYHPIKAEDNNAISLELSEFADSINQGKPVTVSLTDGYDCLVIAHTILEKIAELQAKVSL
ncbi:MAG: Gfo/Idh/MocA family oxidoreductase [Bacteroidota bacterium]|nr:Gfo/Idh/MocA family oxidoreductase [Bacteroidota bacterium]